MMTMGSLFPPTADVSKDLLRKGLVGPVVNVQGFGAAADGISDDQPALAAAAAAAKSEGGTIVLPPGRYSLGKNLILERSASLLALPGAVLVPKDGVVITFDGELSAGAHMVFDLTAPSSAVRGNIKAAFVIPQWFGAVTNDTSAASHNVRAFHAAWSVLTTINGFLLVPPGVYYVDDTIRFTDLVDGKPRAMYGARLIGTGTITAVDTADFSGKPVLHLEGVELAANCLCVDAGRQQIANSPAVGLAVTRDANRKGGGINGVVDISGAYTHAAYYNVCSENCNLQNSAIRNHGTGAVVWDSFLNMPGLAFALEQESNSRKSFHGCCFLSYGGSSTPATIIQLGGVSEFAVTSSYFYMDNGNAFGLTEPGMTVHNLMIRECRCEINLNRPASVTSSNRFLYARANLATAEISFINFESPSDAMVEIDGCIADTIGLQFNSLLPKKAGAGKEVLASNGATVRHLIGAPRYTIEVRNGSGTSYLEQSDISSSADPPIVGDGIYTVAYNNRIVARSSGYDLGPPRAQGLLESLNADLSVDRKAFKVTRSTAFYAAKHTTLAWLSDSFDTHVVTIICPEGEFTVEHNSSPVPHGYRPLLLTNGRAFRGGPGAIITLQLSYGGWREISAVRNLRGVIAWQPGADAGLAAGEGETSPTIVVPGVAFGDFVHVAAPYDLQGTHASAYVSARDTVAIRLQNVTNQHRSFASGNWTIGVER
jgi:hypothetical protein